MATGLTRRALLTRRSARLVGDGLGEGLEGARGDRANGAADPQVMLTVAGHGDGARPAEEATLAEPDWLIRPR